jgi:hypothetical protein
MARHGFSIEQLLEITGLNADVGVHILQGSGVPGGDTGVQDDAPIGSAYLRTNGDLYTKVADTNAVSDWDIKASGLITAPYTPANGTVAVGDTNQEAIEKLDGNQADIQTASGLAQGDVDYGTFTGTVIPDASTSKQALQALETEIEGISGGSLDTAAGVTTATNVSCVLVDDVQGAEWEVVLEDAATPANKKFFKISGLHNGTGAADATLVDDTVFAKLRVGANFNSSAAVVITGVGVAQQFCLEITSTEASGVNVSARKTLI